jgi:2-dehydropantoate 2-reductase
MTKGALSIGTPQRIAVVGAGAVGSHYGALLARGGAPVTLIGRGAHLQAIAAQGLRWQHDGGGETVRLDARTDLAAVAEAGLLLVCVKSPDTEALARAIAPHVRPDALVLSLQNGVDNAATIARHVGVPVAAAVVYAAVECPAPGEVVLHGGGRLVAGLAQPDAPAAHHAALQHAVERLARAGVPIGVSADVRHELWLKLLLNCAYNAISALAQAPYRALAARPAVRELQLAVAAEVIAVARAEGIALSATEAAAAIDRIAATMPAQRSSTAQDLARGRRSEIDHLNGHVARRGQALGVPTPLNRALQTLVRLAEAAPD